MHAISYLVSSAVQDGMEVGNGSFNSADNIFCGKMSQSDSKIKAS
jgi:hypothetical protein